MSDPYAIRARGYPDPFLGSGMTRHDHQATDTPDTLDGDRIDDTTRFIEALVRECGHGIRRGTRLRSAHHDTHTPRAATSPRRPYAPTRRRELRSAARQPASSPARSEPPSPLASSSTVTVPYGASERINRSTHAESR